MLITYNNRGNAKSGLRDYAGAIKDYDKAIELDPTYKYARKNLIKAKVILNVKKFLSKIIKLFS